MAGRLVAGLDVPFRAAAERVLLLAVSQSIRSIPPMAANL
jgi:hypothetical protein